MRLDQHSNFELRPIAVGSIVAARYSMQRYCQPNDLVLPAGVLYQNAKNKLANEKTTKKTNKTVLKMVAWQAISDEQRDQIQDFTY